MIYGFRPRYGIYDNLIIFTVDILQSIKELVIQYKNYKYFQQYSSIRITSKEVPQGSSLSPLLYIIYIEQQVSKYARILEFYIYQKPQQQHEYK